MAKARSSTSCFDIQSPTTGESRIVVEREYVKLTKVGNRYVTASKSYALFDEKGRRYERTSSTVLVTVEGGERFHVVGQADHIRKTA